MQLWQLPHTPRCRGYHRTAPTTWFGVPEISLYPSAQHSRRAPGAGRQRQPGNKIGVSETGLPMASRQSASQASYELCLWILNSWVPEKRGRPSLALGDGGTSDHCTPHHPAQVRATNRHLLRWQEIAIIVSGCRTSVIQIETCGELAQMAVMRPADVQVQVRTEPIEPLQRHTRGRDRSDLKQLK